jgi:hypothetical protein
MACRISRLPRRESAVAFSRLANLRAATGAEGLSCFRDSAVLHWALAGDRKRGNPIAPLPAAAPSLGRQPDRALSEVGATKAIAHRGNVGSACVRCEVTLDRVTSGTILVLNNTNRDEAKQRLAILTFVEE